MQVTCANLYLYSSVCWRFWWNARSKINLPDSKTTCRLVLFTRLCLRNFKLAKHTFDFQKYDHFRCVNFNSLLKSKIIHPGLVAPTCPQSKAPDKVPLHYGKYISHIRTVPLLCGEWRHELKTRRIFAVSLFIQTFVFFNFFFWGGGGGLGGS